ncbi:hypothetical protein [Gloeobacter morelensis]|uniref:Uncharacterized protein n=1 Tax=Gloeobacter morelensis MG652769 TaxID=2781736 RepID=A0ABY3PKJ3_9CYAN|nr:hypothetical protein [Gloeobacter morelensis]UFP94104.1 hypothetical protein ISF26_20435 [Gloeobacter morelensis MG652769]
MSTQITISLPDEMYQRAESLAKLVSREVADILVDAIALSLLPVVSRSQNFQKIAEMSDEEVLALTALQMSPKQDEQLSALLDRQQAGELAEGERSQLMALMQIYQEGLLRKAQALHEAVRRGLREPLSP